MQRPGASKWNDCRLGNVLIVSTQFEQDCVCVCMCRHVCVLGFRKCWQREVLRVKWSGRHHLGFQTYVRGEWGSAAQSFHPAELLGSSWTSLYKLIWRKSTIDLHLKTQVKVQKKLDFMEADILSSLFSQENKTYMEFLALKRKTCTHDHFQSSHWNVFQYSPLVKDVIFMSTFSIWSEF